MASYNTTRYVEQLLDRTEALPPSFTVHLHLEYWTLNNGSKFLYNNQIASLLDDVRAHRIPVDFLDLFEAAKVPFYDGCMIVELLDYRPQRSKEPSPEKPERTRAVLHPNAETLWADICAMNQRHGGKWSDREALEVEARLLLATSPPLCLSPNPHLARIANHVMRVSTPTVPVSLKRKATATLDTQEDESERARRAKIMQFMNPRTRVGAPSYRILDAIQRKREKRDADPSVPLPALPSSTTNASGITSNSSSTTLISTLNTTSALHPSTPTPNATRTPSPTKPSTPAITVSQAHSPAPPGADKNTTNRGVIGNSGTPKPAFANAANTGFARVNGARTPVPGAITVSQLPQPTLQPRIERDTNNNLTMHAQHQPQPQTQQIQIQQHQFISQNPPHGAVSPIPIQQHPLAGHAMPMPPPQVQVYPSVQAATEAGAAAKRGPTPAQVQAVAASPMNAGAKTPVPVGGAAVAGQGAVQGQGQAPTQAPTQAQVQAHIQAYQAAQSAHFMQQAQLRAGGKTPGPGGAKLTPQQQAQLQQHILQQQQVQAQAQAQAQQGLQQGQPQGLQQQGQQGQPSQQQQLLHQQQLLLYAQQQQQAHAANVIMQQRINAVKGKGAVRGTGTPAAGGGGVQGGQGGQGVQQTPSPAVSNKPLLARSPLPPTSQLPAGSPGGPGQTQGQAGQGPGGQVQGHPQHTFTPTYNPAQLRPLVHLPGGAGTAPGPASAANAGGGGAEGTPRQAPATPQAQTQRPQSAQASQAGQQVPQVQGATQQAQTQGQLHMYAQQMYGYQPLGMGNVANVPMNAHAMGGAMNMGGNPVPLNMGGNVGNVPMGMGGVGMGGAANVPMNMNVGGTYGQSMQAQVNMQRMYWQAQAQAQAQAQGMARGGQHAKAGNAR